MKSRGVLISLLLLVLSATMLWAEEDPPSRVARVQYVSGSVSVQPQGTQDWVAAAINRPLTTSDNIWTDKDSRAELSIGTGIFRMNSEASLTFSNLSDNTIQVQLHQGTLNLHIRKLFDGEIYEVDTPNMAFTIQKSGDYRFDVEPEGDASTVTVWKGRGDATGEGPAVRVEAKERARFTNGTTMSHTFSAAPELDGFDDWAVVRDKREDRGGGAYVSADVIGAGDLDEYGTWSEVPEYGHVWVPSHVSAGWAPYRDGHWVFINPWGWTWVDDEPWGFAPFHYGRWVSYGGGWGWAPGPYYARPVYAPALVTWFGGRGWGVGIGFGGGPAYGWCPLGFGEPFVPWYRGSRGYFGRVNISNTRITNINNITNNYYDHRGSLNHFANMRGATAVSEHTMLNSRPVAGSMLRMSQSDFNRAPHTRELGLSPTRTSMLGANAGRPTAVPPQRSFARPVMSNARGPAAGGGREVPAGGNRPEAGRMENGRPEREIGSTREGGFSGNSPMRNVPRPPTGEAARSGAIARNMPESGNSISHPEGTRNVPRPPDGAMRSGVDRNTRDNVNSRSGSSEDHGNFSRPTGSTNVPRPSMNNNGGRSDTPTNVHSGAVDHNAPVSRPSNNERSVQPSNSGRDGQRSEPSRTSRPDGGHSMNVPRPTGPVRQASNQSYDYRNSSQGNRGYSSQDRGGYSSSNRGGYSQSPRSYGSYGAGQQRSYPSSPRYSAPSGGGYSQRSSQSSAGRSAPSSSHSGGSSSSRASGGSSGHSRSR